MIATQAKPKGRTADGKTIVDATIVSNTTPNPLPTTGEGIDGLRADCVFAPLSVLFVVNGGDTYLADENGHFVKQ